jgi:exonuclease VII large subunit
MRRARSCLDGYQRVLQQNYERLRRSTSDGLRQASVVVERTQSELYRRAKYYLMVREQRTEINANNLSHRTQQVLSVQKHRLELVQSRLESHSPDVMIQKGFSLTLYRGKVVKSVNDLQPGAELKTRLRDGIIQSVVTQTEHSND